MDGIDNTAEVVAVAACVIIIAIVFSAVIFCFCKYCGIGCCKQNLQNESESSNMYGEIPLDVVDLVQKLVNRELTMTDEERMAVWHRLQENYCEYCGTKRLPCRCVQQYDSTD